MQPIRLAIAGLGHRAMGAWIPLIDRFFRDFQITVICDPIVALHDKARALLKNPATVKAYAHYEDAIADPNVDAVALTVRCREQGSLAAMALDAGKHVNSEVPAAHTIEDCWRIVLAQERSGKVYQLAEQTRHWGFVEAWRKLVAEGRLGRVTFCEGQYLGYYGTRQFFQDPKTGNFYGVEELAAHPEAKPTWLNRMAPIEYLPHELSPMLKVLNDRVVEVTAMSTRAPSYSHPEIQQPDLQVALMKTEKDAILRMACGFTQPVPHQRGHHWYQVMGTRGCVEWTRSAREKPKMWLADSGTDDVADMDWGFERDDAPPDARGSGHGDADYYVHAAFRDAIMGNKPLDFDVYRAVETAAPAILAAESIARGAKLMRAPNFRPGASRAKGQAPKSKGPHGKGTQRDQTDMDRTSAR